MNLIATFVNPLIITVTMAILQHQGVTTATKAFFSSLTVDCTNLLPLTIDLPPPPKFASLTIDLRLTAVAVMTIESMGVTPP